MKKEFGKYLLDVFKPILEAWMGLSVSVIVLILGLNLLKKRRKNGIFIQGYFLLRKEVN